VKQNIHNLVDKGHARSLYVELYKAEAQP